MLPLGIFPNANVPVTLLALTATMEASCTALTAMLEAITFAGSDPALRFPGVRLVSDAREAMWAVVQQAISTIEFDYVGYAEEHVDRLLSSASAPEFASRLDDAAVPAGHG